MHYTQFELAIEQAGWYLSDSKKLSEDNVSKTYCHRDSKAIITLVKDRVSMEIFGGGDVSVSLSFLAKDMEIQPTKTGDLNIHQFSAVGNVNIGTIRINRET